jgi:hypothetical protein
MGSLGGSRRGLAALGLLRGGYYYLCGWSVVGTAVVYLCSYYLGF